MIQILQQKIAVLTEKQLDIIQRARDDVLSNHKVFEDLLAIQLSSRQIPGQDDDLQKRPHIVVLKTKFVKMRHIFVPRFSRASVRVAAALIGEKEKTFDNVWKQFCMPLIGEAALAALVGEELAANTKLRDAFIEISWRAEEVCIPVEQSTTSRSVPLSFSFSLSLSLSLRLTLFCRCLSICLYIFFSSDSETRLHWCGATVYAEEKGSPSCATPRGGR